MSDYPRTPGSDVRVHDDQWKLDAPFGFCPACGSPAVEDIPIPRDEIINFYCSDTTCRDQRDRRTMWATQKTEELLQREADGGSWNSWKFPGQNLPSICLD